MLLGDFATLTMPTETIVPRDTGATERSPTRHFAVGLARAVGGAIIFGLPLLMTMEMWWLGFYIDRARLALLVVLTLPLLAGLSHISGFEETFDLREDAVDSFVAYAVGFVVGAVVLALLGILRPGMSASEIIGKVALQAVPGSIGALLAHSTLGTNGGREGDDEDDQEDAALWPGYGGQLFRMAAGALFLSFSVAPTDEMVLIAYRMTAWHALALIAASLVVMHAFVYALEFSGQVSVDPGTPFWSVALRYTVAGYVVALVISAYVLWTFGRLDDTGWAERLEAVLVLAFPATVGAAAARLIL